MRNDSIDLWSVDEVHFQQHGSRCRMWIPPEIKDPVVLHARPARAWGILGPCACGMAALCSVRKPANSELDMATLATVLEDSPPKCTTEMLVPGAA